MDDGTEVRKQRKAKVDPAQSRVKPKKGSTKPNALTKTAVLASAAALLRRQCLGPAFEAPRRRDATDRHGKASELLSAARLRVRCAPLLPRPDLAASRERRLSSEWERRLKPRLRTGVI